MAMRWAQLIAPHSFWTSSTCGATVRRGRDDAELRKLWLTGDAQSSQVISNEGETEDLPHTQQTRQEKVETPHDVFVRDANVIVSILLL